MANEQALANRGRRTHPKRAKFPREFVSKARLSKWHDIMVLQTKNPATLNTPVTDAGRYYSALWAESLLRASEQSSCNAHSNPTCAAYKQGSSRLRAPQLTNLLIAQRQRQILPFFPPSLTLPPSHPPWKRLCRASNPAALKPSRLRSLDDCLPFKTTTWQTEERASERARGRGEARRGGEAEVEERGRERRGRGSFSLRERASDALSFLFPFSSSSAAPHTFSVLCSHARRKAHCSVNRGWWMSQCDVINWPDES